MSDERGEDVLAALAASVFREALTPLQEKVGALELRICERLATLEAREPAPGPAGADGKDGAPGAPGLGVSDLAVVQLTDRDYAVKATAADGRTLEVGRLRVPVLLDRGVYVDGKAYEQGDGVTHGGSFWICQRDGALGAPDTPAGAARWRLAVKRGRDGGRRG